MRSENLAVMLTDIEGFTERTSQRTRAETERLLQLHEALLLPVFRVFNGVVRKSLGDAFLVTFESPTNAVVCGAAIVDRLSSFNQTAPEADRLSVRVVVNAGEVRVDAVDVLGEPVAVAQAIESQADAGEVTFTEAVFLVMNKAEVPSIELGEVPVRGLKERVRLFKIPRGGGPGAPPSPLPFGGLGLARAGNLPEPNLADIERALVAKQSRRALWARAQQHLRSKGALRVAAAVMGLVALGAAVMGIRFLRTPAIERALAHGELARAQALAQKIPEGAARTFWSARIEEAQGHASAAVGHYLSAARDAKWTAPVVERFAAMAQGGTCEVKSRVADALGALGDPSGRAVLEGLTQEDPKRAGGLGGLFGQTCDPAAHARRALAKLGKIGK